MNSRLDSHTPLMRLAPSRTVDRLGRWVLKRVLARLEVGDLTVILPSGDTVSRIAVTVQDGASTARQGAGGFPQSDSGEGLSSPPRGPDALGESATLHLHRWRALWRLVREGDVGFAESYIDGDWSSPSLAAFVALAARNATALDGAMSGSILRRLGDRLRHLRRANTHRGAKRNISAHYDLGNDFYREWLDASLSYSSAMYRSPDDTLEVAQQRKLDTIVERLELKGGESVLEIGCGWGALALRLAAAGCRVRAITLSQAQQTVAAERVRAAGLSDRIDVGLVDYRDIEGQFDRIVSIEMFEAVGQAYWQHYFNQLRTLLTPTGMALLQVITIDPRRFDRYANDVDFIQRHVFPGGMLPTPGHLETLADGAGLSAQTLMRFGACYAKTLHDWHQRFESTWPRLQQQGFDTRFKRLWEYYLQYCEGGFAAGAIDVGLYAMRRGV